MAKSASLQVLVNACLDGLVATQTLSPRQWQVCHHIRDCRTAVLGGFALHCDQCDADALCYHACRDRHCPRCQRQASEAWCARQRAALLPVTYHHLVFTLPSALNGWIEVHPKQLYDLLFETVWATLSAFGANPKRLDGQLGMTAVLHTWGQTLTRHVHLHCLVPGGAFSATGQWHPAKSTYLFPVRALSRHVRGGFVSRLRQAVAAGELSRLTDPREIDRMLDTLMGTEWVVFSKPCLARGDTVVDYLGRYSHRTALSDSRLLSFDGESVELSYKDYRDGDQRKVMTLSGEELLRRFLLHVLPKGFMRVRHFGFLANRCRAQRLPAIRAAIGAVQARPVAIMPTEPGTTGHPQPSKTFDGFPCQSCRGGRLRVRTALAPKRRDGG
ncbi:Putative transposase [Thiorhodovibrio winogradskyi]|uniref:Transposase n=1 Tax=Thiorhodovibrio winogradskyi TaxID=77007 RepID=A0ABZ0S788_9GAMM|nr:IS91 family transposase [Thiorhodovibrio winogradskyi]